MVPWLCRKPEVEDGSGCYCLVLARAQPLTPVGRVLGNIPGFDSASPFSVFQPLFLPESYFLRTQDAAPRWASQMFFCFELELLEF